MHVLLFINLGNRSNDMENGINNMISIGTSRYPKWIQINEYTFVNDVSGDIWINIEKSIPT